MSVSRWRPRLRALIVVMRWLGLAIADAASLKRSELVYDEDTGFWCVGLAPGRKHKKGTGSPRPFLSISASYSSWWLSSRCVRGT